MRTVALAVSCLAVVTACGGSSGASTTSSPPPPGSTATVTATAPAPVTTTTSAAGTRCRSADLRLSLGVAGVGLSNLGQAIVLTNASKRTCTVYGYPGVDFLGASRQDLHLTPGRGSTYIASDTGPHTVTLAPGATASATIGLTDGDVTGKGCPTASYLEVTPPDETVPLVTSWGKDGAPAQVCGLTDVTALTAGPLGGQSS